MILAFAAIGLFLVVLIALLAVGKVVGRLRVEPLRNVFEGDEALEFVAQALPSGLTAELSYEDVQRILRFHSDFLHAEGVARSGGDLKAGRSGGPHILATEDAVQYVMGRAGRAGFFPREVHVSEVIKAQFAYFEAIGAVSEVADPARELEADLAATDLPNEPQPNN